MVVLFVTNKKKAPGLYPRLIQHYQTLSIGSSVELDKQKDLPVGPKSLYLTYYLSAYLLDGGAEIEDIAACADGLD